MASQNGVDVYWALYGGDFLAALHRAHQGEDPELLYAEYYANSDREEVPPGDSNG